MEAADRITPAAVEGTLVRVDRVAAGTRLAAVGAAAASAVGIRRVGRRWRGRAEDERLEPAHTVRRRARREDIRPVLTAVGATAGRVAATAADRQPTGSPATRAAAPAAATVEVTAHRDQMAHTVGAVVRGRVPGIHTQIRATDGPVATTDQHRIAAIQGRRRRADRTQGTTVRRGWRDPAAVAQTAATIRIGRQARSEILTAGQRRTVGTGARIDRLRRARDSTPTHSARIRTTQIVRVATR